ncbi:CRISPR-associated protein Cas4 [Kurthia massiliensis]|uniref:CRISPR-associated protein Cas4 n=1 Tax=Kurthia massiliensis TaxID=1033739 RepID=UPI00028A23CD|nr:CRISPR-associated protein Cas4 [Kurthia massiliensis]
MKEFNEEAEYLMLSGIQHFQFCRRQWALIHIEQQWAENVKTVEGMFVHERADQPMLREKRGSKLIVRALPVKSNTLKVTGICDVVEFIEDKNGINLYGEEGTYQPYPVEYKRGKPKKGQEDILQLAAQCMCLEEMLMCHIPKAYIFYNEVKKRIEIEISSEIREKVKNVFNEMHQYYERRYTPKVRVGKHCDSCSLNNICLPILNGSQEPVRRYLERYL